MLEARALAKLNHPNVITVHDVGSFQDHVFIAMEIIDGWNANEWARETKRSWREVLDTYVKAGHGLVAAHGASIIHRDFKPDNILVGRSGRVRVTDFGIARVRKRGTDSAVRELQEEASTDDPDTRKGLELFASAEGRLTAPGSVPGTAGYIAPEQYEGIDASERSDQFSFCVSLYEALYGQRPFAGETHAAIAFAIISGTVQEPPRGFDVPGWLRRVLLRGLAVKPEDRYPSMQALLDDLSKNPEVQRRQTRTLFLGGLAVAAGIFAFASTRQGAAEPCPAPTQKFAGLWDGAVRDQVAERFASSGLPFADDSLASVSGAFDAYVEDWVRLHGEVCRATHVHKEQSESVLDLRMGCLEQRRRELGATAQVLTQADRKTLQQGVVAARSLPGLARCSDVPALQAQVPPPEDPESRAEAERIRSGLPQVRSARLAGRYAEALAAARVAVDDAIALGFAPLVAETRFLLAESQRDAGETASAEATLREVIRESAGISDPELTAKAWSALVFALSQSAPEEALHLELAADAAVRAAGDAPHLRAKLLGNLTAALLRAKRYEEARTRASEAIAVYEKSKLPLDQALGSFHSNLAASYYYLKDKEQARANWLKASEIYTTTLGPGHPDIASILTNTSQLTEDDAEALDLLERALVIHEAARGDEHLFVGTTLNNMASRNLGLRRFAAAESSAKRAIGIYEGAFGKDSDKVAIPLLNLTESLLWLERASDAQPVLERATKLLATSGDEELERRIAVFEARILIAAGKSAEAKGRLDQVVKNIKTGTDPVKIARVDRWRAMAAVERDPAEAEALAKQAVEALRAGGEASEAAEIENWAKDRF
jgi:tetratricopeptide (TPR) repeat protein